MERDEPIRIELPTIFGLKKVNSWLFMDPVPTLVDCGEKTEETWDALSIGLSKHGLEIGDIKRIIITHGHLDHMGMANRIVANSDARVWVNEYLYDWAVNLKVMLDRRSDAIMGLMRANLPEDQHIQYKFFGYEALSPLWEEIPADRLEIFPLEGNIRIGAMNWEIIHTPGHCINQTCFYNQESGYFLSADMLLRMIPIPIIDAGLSAPYPRTKSLVMQLESYDKISKLNISKVFPGHFDIIDNAQELMALQVQKIHQRKEMCFHLFNKGTTEILDLTHAIYPDRINPATLFMVVGFLDILKEEKRIDLEL